jgi:hypothetical protein
MTSRRTSIQPSRRLSVLNFLLNTYHQTTELVSERLAFSLYPFTMSGEAQSYYNSAPSDKDTPQQDRGLFDHESKKHECHHYARMYGGQAVNAMMWGFGATLGADAANAAVGEMRVCFIQGCDSRVMLTMIVAMVETLRNESYICLVMKRSHEQQPLQACRRMEMIKWAMSSIEIDIN